MNLPVDLTLHGKNAVSPLFISKVDLQGDNGPWSPIILIIS